MKSSLAVIFLLLISTALNAETLKEKTWGCATQEQLRELINAKIKKDHRSARYLMVNKFCTFDAGGAPVTILEKAGKFTKVRIYPKGDIYKAMEIWVVSKDIIP